MRKIDDQCQMYLRERRKSAGNFHTREHSLDHDECYAASFFFREIVELSLGRVVECCQESIVIREVKTAETVNNEYN